MKLIFTFTNSPDLKAATRLDVYRTSFELPDEVQYLIGYEQRILAVAEMIGSLTYAALHLTCPELNLRQHPIKLTTSITPGTSLSHNICNLVIVFERFARYRKSQQLRILAPTLPQVPQGFLVRRGRNRREKHNLKRNLRPIGDYWGTTDEQRAYANNLQHLVEQLLVLLNAKPANIPTENWYCAGFHPMWVDNRLIDLHNKRRKQYEAERRKQERLEEKRRRQEAKTRHTASDAPTLAESGAGRRPGAIPGVFKGVQFRSQLEIRFATELEARGVRWVYETERLGEGNYLVDFYLPDLGTWVEVKGRFEPRDNYLLKEVAAYLKKERGERLLVYTNGTCYAVHPTRFTEIKRNNFWERLLGS